MSRRFWLQTSPEFAMKRMLAAGAGRIYQVARVFRLDEIGPLHNPEFTLVEWYQPGEGLEEGMQLTADLCEALLSSRHTPCAVRTETDNSGLAAGIAEAHKAVSAGQRPNRSPSPGQRPGGESLSSPSIGPTGQLFGERLARRADDAGMVGPASPGRCPGLGERSPFGAATVAAQDLATPNADGTRSVPATFSAEWLSYGEAFQRHVGIDPHTSDGKRLAAVAKELGVEAPASLSTEDRDGWLDLLMVERVQPHLGQERPTLLFDYPASQAALARVRPGNPPVAERFELFIGGVEIANGYNELLDPAELRARNARVNAQRRADGKPALPEESRLLAAMESGLPASVGVALGFDRLVMAALGAKSIAEVIAFPFDRA
jgi:elongation factor P--beta-lysine ligase